MQKVLIDSGVWIDHFRKGNDKLLMLLDMYKDHKLQIMQHDMVVGELMLGGIPDRINTYRLLNSFSKLPLLSAFEFITFIENNDVQGSGVGYVDGNIIASCKLADCKLWTLDSNLNKLAKKLGVCWE